MIKKTIIINRAVPGSGKTTITNCIIDKLRDNNISVSVHSTDEYFMIKDRYVFEIEHLGKYHQENLEEFRKSIENRKDVIICDNTNIAPWQIEPYTILARKHGYQIIVLTLDPRELEKHVASQQVTPEKPDAHAVDEEILKRMIVEYNLFDDLLNPRIIIDPQKHIHYEWDDEEMETVKIGVAKHFDLDYLIRIFPNEYQDTQKKIGQIILSLIKEGTQ